MVSHGLGLGGHGVLLLSEHEQFFLRDVRDLPLVEVPYNPDEACNLSNQQISLH